MIKFIEFSDPDDVIGFIFDTFADIVGDTAAELVGDTPFDVFGDVPGIFDIAGEFTGFWGDFWGGVAGEFFGDETGDAWGAWVSKNAIKYVWVSEISPHISTV